MTTCQHWTPTTMSSRMRAHHRVHKPRPPRLPAETRDTQDTEMSLPLSIFKTPSSISLPLSFDNDTAPNGDESKRKSIFGARRKNPRQSRIFSGMQPSQKENHDQVCSICMTFREASSTHRFNIQLSLLRLVLPFRYFWHNKPPNSHHVFRFC